MAKECAKGTVWGCRCGEMGGKPDPKDVMKIENLELKNIRNPNGFEYPKRFATYTKRQSNRVQDQTSTSYLKSNFLSQKYSKSNLIWGGCSEDVDFAMTFSRRFDRSYPRLNDLLNNIQKKKENIKNQNKVHKRHTKLRRLNMTRNKWLKMMLMVSHNRDVGREVHFFNKH